VNANSVFASVVVGSVFAFALALVTWLNNPAAVMTVCVIGTGTAFAMLMSD
jgi:hypothetical protein